MSGYHDEGIVDVERRKQSIEYNFGDPTLFPPEYLNWLKRFIEQSGIQLPASSIFGALTPGGVGSLKNISPGVILPYGGAVVPLGALPCNGQVVLIDDYPKLFEIIGTVWGPATGTTFTVPDLRDRSLYGVGSMPLAATDGRAAGSRGPSHHHHFTKVVPVTSSVSVSVSVGVSVSGATDGVGDHAHGYNLSGPNYVTRQQGTAGPFFDPVDSLNYTNVGTGGAGAHAHNFSGSGGGSGSGSGTGTGDANVDGDTSGGGGQDTPGYGVVAYVITTG